MISVLLVEPHDDTRELYAEFLRYSGFRVYATGSTDEACTLAAHADVVITVDRVPSGHDGLGLMRWLRSRPEMRLVPVIAISASPFAAEAEAARQAGCDLFLTKPCLPEDLAAHVRRLVKQQTVAPRPARVPATGRSAHRTRKLS